MARYVEQSLQPSEVVEYWGKASWIRVLFRPLIAIIIGVVLMGIAGASGNNGAANNGFSTGADVVATIGVVLAVSGLIGVVRAILFVIGAEYAVTDRRVVGKYGIIRRVAVDVMITQISGVSVAQPALGRFFNYGTIWVNASGTRRALIGIAKPLKFRAAVYNRLEESRLLKGTAAYTLDVRIAPDPPVAQAPVPGPAYPPAPQPAPVYQHAQGQVPAPAGTPYGAAGPVTRYCGQCGTAVQAPSRFCANCGTAVG